MQLLIFFLKLRTTLTAHFLFLVLATTSLLVHFSESDSTLRLVKDHVVVPHRGVSNDETSKATITDSETI
ncbi:MAG: hypothetical protein VXZ18_19385, partial [Pseudomonadota bacterium]|nr:hypothetical protein [Pseudomonadota bacterium]